MISIAQAQQFVFICLTLRDPILKGHFNGHLDAYRATVCQKYLIQPLWCYFNQFFAEIDRRGVGNTAKHYMTDFIDLLHSGFIEHRVIISVDGAPPGGHAIDQLSTIGQTQHYTIG